MKSASISSVWVVDAIKAVASQVIVWHHFISYGPLARALYPYASDLFDYLHRHGPKAVQAFLVVGGFLAARSLVPYTGRSIPDLSVSKLLHLFQKRYMRLLRPYLIALALAMGAAACARLLISDPDTPAAASLKQVFMHVLLIHDIAGVPALSTGVWYVAIDLQLYGLWLLILWAVARLAPVFRLEFRTTGLWIVMGLLTLSLLGFNRITSIEIWAIYFFGAYGMGILVHWASGDQSKLRWLAALLVVCFIALVVEWRGRIGVSLFTAGLLTLALQANSPLSGRLDPFIRWLGNLSYSVFLVHYPVVLLVGALVAFLWPGDVLMAGMGFFISWLTTMGLAHLIYQRVERPRADQDASKPSRRGIPV